MGTVTVCVYIDGIDSLSLYLCRFRVGSNAEWAILLFATEQTFP